MGLYQPQKGLAGDSAAMGGSIMAIDAANMQLYGAGILEGMALSSTGVIGAGYALVGHVIAEPGGTNLAPMFAGTGTWDLYVQAPGVVYNASGLATSGAVGGSGTDVPSYVRVPSGQTPPGAIIATVTVSGGAITSVNDKRNILVTPQSLTPALQRLMNRETVYYNTLTAPLPTPLLFLAPSAMQITGAILRTSVAPQGQSIIARIQRNGLDVWTSAQGYPQIFPTQTLGVAPSPAGSYSCAQYDLLSVDLTQPQSRVGFWALAISRSSTAFMHHMQ